MLAGHGNCATHLERTGDTNACQQYTWENNHAVGEFPDLAVVGSFPVACCRGAVLAEVAAGLYHTESLGSGNVISGCCCFQS